MNILRRYIFWTYERGSFHYDVMVTLILLFLFVSPHIINYKDKPVETVALHASEVLVREAGTFGRSSRWGASHEESSAELFLLDLRTGQHPLRHHGHADPAVRLRVSAVH